MRTAADDPEAAVGRIIELAKTRIPSGSEMTQNGPDSIGLQRNYCPGQAQRARAEPAMPRAKM